MEIYVLRHGESTANIKNLVCGCSDFPLSDKGNMQSHKICNHLDNINFTYIYSSSLSRAINTINKLKNPSKIQIEPQIKELDTGSVSSLSLPELWEKDNRFRKPWLFPNLRYPGGETFNEMFTRISSWFDVTRKSWFENDIILIVGHEGTLRTIYSNMMNINILSYPDFPIRNCDYLHFKTTSNNKFIFEHVEFKNIPGDMSK